MPKALPNAITAGRLLAVPGTVWLIALHRFDLAFWLFVAAGLSDGIDGFIAKRFNARTELGAILDPLADKALLVGVYLSLGQEGQLPAWLVLLVVGRDILIVSGAFFAHRMKLAMQPLPISKLNTVVQILLAGLVLADLGFGLREGGLVAVLIWAAAATTVLSGATYVVVWAPHAKQGRRLRER